MPFADESRQPRRSRSRRCRDDRNVDTNVARTVITETRGLYRALNLPVGHYALVAEHPGFAKSFRSGVTLVVDQDALVDIDISPAEVTESIDVRDDAPFSIR